MPIIPNALKKIKNLKSSKKNKKSTELKFKRTSERTAEWSKSKDPKKLKELKFKRTSERTVEWSNPNLSMKTKMLIFKKSIMDYIKKNTITKLKKEYPYGSKFFLKLLSDTHTKNGIFLVWMPGTIYASMLVLPTKFKNIDYVLKGLIKEGYTFDSIYNNSKVREWIFRKTLYLDYEIDPTLYNNLMTEIKGMMGKPNKK